jgi:regulator of sirC expression with transglutaminase-like and TPR domain
VKLENKRILFIYPLLAAVTLAVFWQLNRCDFINYDDNEYVSENPQVQNGITSETIRWAFTTHHSSNWHPVTWISHMLDVELFGLNPHRHHQINLLFHIANTLLLFFVLNRMTGAPWKSAFVAALFALHPLHVESVAWVAERKDVLSTFFWMLTMAAYFYYVKGLPASRPLFSALRYLVLLIFFILGLMSKPMLVTVPIVLLLLDYWPLRRFGPDPQFDAHVDRTTIRARAWELIFEKIPLFALAGVACIITFVAHNRGGAVKSTNAFPAGVRIENAIVSCALYIKKAVWPTDLAIFYPHPGSWPAWQVLGAAFLLGAITLTVFRTTRRFPYLTVGWLWFTITLAPVIGIVQVGNQAMADRYTYVPLIGLFMMAAWLIPELMKKWRYCKQACFVLSALILAALSIATWVQTGYWLDGVKLYNHTLAINDNNDIIHYNRGIIYCQLGDFRQAVEDFDKVIDIAPWRAEAYYSRGAAYGRLGDYREAIKNYDEAIRIDPSHAWFYNDRGSAQDAVGNYKQAIEDFSRAIDLDSNHPLGYYNRAIVYSKLRQDRAAMEDLKKAARLGSEEAKEILRKRGINW